MNNRVTKGIKLFLHQEGIQVPIFSIQPRSFFILNKRGKKTDENRIPVTNKYKELLAVMKNIREENRRDSLALIQNRGA